MSEVVAFPSIEKFRHAIASVRRAATYVGHDVASDRPIFDDSVAKPTLTYRGTVKLHGSNTGIVFFPDASVQFQSRNCVLTHTSDYAGFVVHLAPHADYLTRLKEGILDAVRGIAEHASDDDKAPTVAVFGEWCGGAIQAGVALAELPKMFVVFAVSVNNKWVDMAALPRSLVEYEPARIFHIHTFGEWLVTIDFNTPEVSQPELERLTAAVEAECPAGKYFGVSGVGEVIVWTCISPGYNNSRDTSFKVKGDKHANPGATPRKAKAAATRPDIVPSVQAFVDEFVTEGRLAQGLTILDERGLDRSMNSLGEFIKWVQGDVLKEEADTIAANELSAKMLIAPIAAKARDWFKEAVKKSP